MAKKTRIIVEHDEKDGIRVKVNHAFSPEHAVWVLAQGISIIAVPEVKEDDVQELPDATESEEETDVPNVQ